MIKVSIIVPIYNVEKFLDRCIRSLLSQTLKDIEIILVDDESPDKCPEICDEYARNDSRIKVIHKKNAGLGMARNSGIEVAIGEYITFCDSDDFVDSNTYQTIYHKCKSNDLDMCCFQYRRISEDETKILYSSHLPEQYFQGPKEVNRFIIDLIGKNYEDKSSYNYNMSSCMALFRRDLFTKSHIRYPNERIVASEDLVFLLYFLPFVNKIGIVPDVLYNYRVNPNSISQNFSKEKYDRLMNLLIEVKSYCENNYDYEVYKNHYFSQQLRIFKIILKHISISQFSFTKKNRLIEKLTKDPQLSAFYHDPVRHKYGLANNIYIFCMKHHISLFFILLYNIRK